MVNRKKKDGGLSSQEDGSLPLFSIDDCRESVPAAGWRYGTSLNNAGLTTSSILANGDIAACASIRSDYAQGNIYRGDDFIDVWENRYQVFRDRSWMRQRGDECGRCKYFRYCLGGSMHLRESDGSLRPGTCRMLR